MMLTSKKVTRLLFALFCVALLVPHSSLMAQEETDEATSPGLFNSSGKISFTAFAFGGTGSDDLNAFESDAGDTVTISGGGGTGGGLSIAYGVGKSLELSAGFGLQKSSLSEDLGNADGEFKRTFMLGTVKFKIPVSNSSQIKLGGGLGNYSGGDLDIDGSQVPGGAHLIWEYDAAIGFHLAGDFEFFFQPAPTASICWSLGLGLKYYSVTYDLSAFSIDGVNIPLNMIVDEYLREWEELDGSGFDVSLFVSLYLI